MNFTVLAKYLPAYFRYRRGIANVTWVRGDARSFWSGLANGLLQSFSTPTEDDHAPVLCRKLQGDRSAYAAAAAGHNCCLLHNSTHCFVSADFTAASMTANARAPSWKLGVHGR